MRFTILEYIIDILIHIRKMIKFLYNIYKFRNEIKKYDHKIGLPNSLLVIIYSIIYGDKIIKSTENDFSKYYLIFNDITIGVKFIKYKRSSSEYDVFNINEFLKFSSEVDMNIKNRIDIRNLCKSELTRLENSSDIDLFDDGSILARGILNLDNYNDFVYDYDFIKSILLENDIQIRLTFYIPNNSKEYITHKTIDSDVFEKELKFKFNSSYNGGLRSFNILRYTIYINTTKTNNFLEDILPDKFVFIKSISSKVNFNHNGINMTQYVPDINNYYMNIDELIKVKPGDCIILKPMINYNNEYDYEI